MTDTIAGVETYPLPRYCTKGLGWQQVTASLTDGYRYQPTFINGDGNGSRDPDVPDAAIFEVRFSVHHLGHVASWRSPANEIPLTSPRPGRAPEPKT